MKETWLCALVVFAMSCNRTRHTDLRQNSQSPPQAPKASPSAVTAPSAAASAEIINPLMQLMKKGSSSAADVTTNPQYVTNRGFDGKVWLLVDQHSNATPGSTLLPRSQYERPWSEGEDQPYRILFYLEGGALSRLCSASSPYPRILMTNFNVELSTAGVRVGEFPATGCKPLKLLFSASDSGCRYDAAGVERCRTVVLHHDFEAGRLTTTSLGHHFCHDAAEHHVALYDKKGGRLLIHSVLNLDAFEFDLDGDGRKDLFVVSSDACGLQLRVLRITAA